MTSFQNRKPDPAFMRHTLSSIKKENIEKKELLSKQRSPARFNYDTEAPNASGVDLRASKISNELFDRVSSPTKSFVANHLDSVTRKSHQKAKSLTIASSFVAGANTEMRAKITAEARRQRVLSREMAEMPDSESGLSPSYSKPIIDVFE